MKGSTSFIVIKKKVYFFIKNSCFHGYGTRNMSCREKASNEGVLTSVSYMCIKLMLFIILCCIYNILSGEELFLLISEDINKCSF